MQQLNLTKSYLEVKCEKSHRERPKMIISKKKIIFLYTIHILNHHVLSFTFLNHNRIGSHAQSKVIFAFTDSDSMKINNLDGRDIHNEIRPISNIILVQNVPTIDKTESGLILTGKEKIVKSQGVVVSTGPGRINSETGFRYPMSINQGDSVLYEKYCETEINYNCKKHSLIRDDDVLISFPSGKSRTIKHAQLQSDNILVKVDTLKNNFGDFIFLQSPNKLKSSIGQVVKVGPGAWTINGILMEMNVAVGDRVKYHCFSGKKVEIGDDSYIVLKTKDLMLKF